MLSCRRILQLLAGAVAGSFAFLLPKPRSAGAAAVAPEVTAGRGQHLWQSLGNGATASCYDPTGKRQDDYLYLDDPAEAYRLVSTGTLPMVGVRDRDSRFRGTNPAN